MTTPRRLFGNSIQSCLQSITAGEVDINEIGLIYSDVDWSNDDEFLDLVSEYAQNYWSHPGNASVICLILLKRGLIVQPHKDFGAAPRSIDRNSRVGNIRDCWTDDPCKITFTVADFDPWIYFPRVYISNLNG